MLLQIGTMFLSAVLLILILLVTIIYIIYKNNTHLKDIPRPPCSIFLGHFPQLKDVTKILEVLTNYTLQYGGLLRIYIPPMKPSLLITDPEVVKILLTSNKEVNKSKDYRFSKPWLGNGLIVSDVDKWAPSRRMLTPCFGRLSLLKKFINVFDILGDILIANLITEIDKENVDVFPLIKKYSMDIICETSMGVSLNAQTSGETEYVKSIEQICQVVTNRMKTPYKRFDFIFRFTEDYKIQTAAIKVINSFFYNIINTKTKSATSRRGSKQEDLKPAFLDLLLQLHDKDKKFTLTDIKDEVNNFMVGGHDTTATGIAFTLYSLARHPKVQEKVVQEQLNIFGKLDKISPSYDDLQNMKYLELVIYEALRLFPPIPGIGRRIVNDIKLENGLILPKNLNVVIFIYGCHRNPKYFQDPEKFIPERFEKDDIVPFTFLPFSFGPRNCIGRKFAMLQMKSCISKIIRNFKLQPSNPEYVLELIPQFTLASRNGIRLSLQRRVA